jgi:hypothetical protein
MRTKHNHQMLVKMDTNNLLSLIAKGNMNVKEATIAATILERRFPSPAFSITRPAGMLLELGRTRFISPLRIVR